MSVAETDLRVYGAASMPEDDGSTVGGAIDLGTKVVFTDLAVNDTFDFVSDDAGDTDQIYRVSGLDAAGAREQEDETLNGLTIVPGALTFERAIEIERLSGSALLGTVTVTENSGGTTVATLEGAADAGAGTEIDMVRKLFHSIASDPDAEQTFYEKVFFRNNHATETLIDAFVSLMDGPVYSTPTAVNVDQNSDADQTTLYVDSTTGFTVGMSIVIASGVAARSECAKIASVSAGTSLTLTDNLKNAHTAAQNDAVAKSRITLDVEGSLDGTDTSTNRKTAPSGYGYVFDCSDHNVASLQNLAPGSAQGVWLKLVLDAAQAAFQDTYKLNLTGNTA